MQQSLPHDSSSYTYKDDGTIQLSIHILIDTPLQLVNIILNLICLLALCLGWLALSFEFFISTPSREIGQTIASSFFTLMLFSPLLLLHFSLIYYILIKRGLGKTPKNISDYSGVICILLCIFLILALVISLQPNALDRPVSLIDALIIVAPIIVLIAIYFTIAFACYKTEQKISHLRTLIKEAEQAADNI